MGVRLEGVAVSWRSGQAFFVPLHRRTDLLAELAPLFACPTLEKATWDLRSQLAALARLMGRAVLGVPGMEAPGGQPGAGRRTREPAARRPSIPAPTFWPRRRPAAKAARVLCCCVVAKSCAACCRLPRWWLGKHAYAYMHLPGLLVGPAADQLVLRDPLADVRVAAWLSTPDDKRLMDTNPLLAGSRHELLTLDGLLK